MRKQLFSALLIIILYSLSFAQDNAGMMAGSFERLGVSGRVKAMGDAGTAIADGYSTAYDNPAFLPALDMKYAGITMHRLALDRRFTHLALVSPLKGDAGVSLSWINAGVDNIDSRDFDGNQLKSLSYYDNAFALGFAISPVPKKVSIGLNFKVFYGLFPKIKDDGSAIKGTGIGFDFGGRVVLPYDLTAGIVVKDLGGKYTWNTDGYWSEGTTKTDMFPVQTRVGLAYNKEALTATLDAEVSTGQQKLRAGSEYRIRPDEPIGFAFRVGMDGSSPTFGLGFHWPIAGQPARLDYAYVMEAIAPNDTHVLTWSVAF